MALKSRIVDRLENRDVVDWSKEQTIISYVGAADKTKRNMYAVDLKKLVNLIEDKKKDTSRIKRMSETLMVYKKRLDDLGTPEKKMMRLRRQYEEQKQLYEEEKKKYDDLSKRAAELETKYNTLQKVPRVKAIEYEKKAMEFLKTHSRATTSEIASYLAIQTSNASRMLKKLVRDEKIIRIQRGVFSTNPDYKEE